MKETWIKEAYQGEVPEGTHNSVKWQSPSNIALVKYWGKKGRQLPQNPSISFTLSHCKTETSIFYEKSDRLGLQFSFNGKKEEKFQAKIKDYLLENIAFFPFLNQLDLDIRSRNTFPHSSGIASSASSMSALVMCLLDVERQLKGTPEIDLRKASYLSRLASGSACRSLFSTLVLWGAMEAVKGSSDEYAVTLEQQVHPIFRCYRDSILIVSDTQKEVSSRAGHALMDTNPYAEVRYDTARKDANDLLQALTAGDLEAFIRITESEALQLHALMMCSQPSFILMKPNTLRIINAIHVFRKETDIPVCFTLDAGPNVHVLYPGTYAELVERFIMDELERFCSNGQWINDIVGFGASKCH